ncbi:MAG: PEP-CTERM system histidine kinase PrsK [Ectothiorhodospiraceae bacterium]|nr:PEP-CTERM system histidine kinase PrsK [Ectothiorhodospiraceae bacterium]
MDLAGVVSYGVCAVAFAVLMLLLMPNSRGRLLGRMLLAACGLTALWAAVVAWVRWFPETPVVVLELAEVAKLATWLALLVALLRPLRPGSGVIRVLTWLAVGGAAVAAVWLLWVQLLVQPELVPVGFGLQGGFVIAALALSLLGLILLEQLYRNLPPERRWGMKFLCLGIAVLFGFDLYLYSDALLFRQLDLVAWDARGLVQTLAAPLILVAARRNPDWAPPVFVSRHVVFHTAAILAVGVYLLLIAVGGYYIRDFGGTWGGFAQIVLMAAAVLGLVVVLGSADVRARLRVFVAKHFFSNKYDYREEWLRLTQRLARDDDGVSPYQRAVHAMAEVFGCPAGAVWRRDDDGFQVAGAWRMKPPGGAEVPESHPLVGFLRQRQWVIDLEEYRAHPERYAALALPAWMLEPHHPGIWVVVPLLRQDTLTGFVLLCTPEPPMQITWEDRDLLKVLGREVAAYLGQHEYAQALAQARQFEAFNQLTAFLMHDLKNLIAQQSLVVKNAEKHKRNPAFIDDAMETIGSSVARMERLLEHLQRSQRSGIQERVELRGLLEDAVARCADRTPRPELTVSAGPVFVAADREELVMVVVHLIRNAQDATPADGHVRVLADEVDDTVSIRVVDTGEGMTGAFIRDELFKPFHTTKSAKGMGIGAHQVREFVRRAGGRVKVTSSPGEGTEFEISLPCERRQEADGVGAERIIHGQGGQ